MLIHYITLRKWLFKAA